jgi:hypothetical protein
VSNRRRISQPAGSCRVVTYLAAVRHIADCLDDRTHFVAGIPPHMIETAASATAGVPGRWFLDSGASTVVQASGTAALALASLLGDLAAAVVTIPKTVPHALIRGALGDLVPADGSQDIIMVGADDDTVTMWPRLLTAAIAIVDPAAASLLAANDVRNLS